MKIQIFVNLGHFGRVCPDILPMHISPFGVKDEVELKVPKQGLYKIYIGMYTL